MCIAIQGRKGTGKTDYALHMTEILYEKGIFKRIGTNIRNLENTPIEYDFIDNYPKLLETCISYNKPYLFVLDELGDTAPKDSPWLNPEIIRALQKIRKYKLSLIGCSIYDVDRRVLNPKHFDGYFEKLSRDDKTIATFHDWLGDLSGDIYDIERTRIKFDSYDAAIFHMKGEDPESNDRDIQIAIEWAQKKPYGGELSKQGRFDAIRRGVMKLVTFKQSSSQGIVARGVAGETVDSEG